MASAGQPSNSAPVGDTGRGEENGNGSSGSADGEIFTHQVVHAGVVCDVCDKVITGFRYKCMQCRDYDLCSICERRGLHAGHIMMRIAFPEMTADALRRYLPQADPAMPRRPFSSGNPGLNLGHPHGHGHGHHSAGEKGKHGRRDHREGWGHCGGEASSAESSDETKFPWGQGCPYRIGKKELKKWAKCMKKTAHAHKRSAEAYATQAGADAATGSAAAGAEAQPPRSQQPAFDFTAAASQIQDVLNAFGVPIDVVELYDEWGNTSGRANANDANSQPQAGQASSASGESGSANMGKQQNLSDQLEQMNLGNETGTTSSSESVPNTASPQNAVAPASNTGVMDVESDSGWTLLEPDRIAVDPGTTNNQPSSVNDIAAPPVSAVNSLESSNSTNETIREIPIRIDGVYSNATSSATDSAPTTAPPLETSSARPVYPTLPTFRPQFQQVFQGITNAADNIARGFMPATTSIPQQQYPTPPVSIPQQPQLTENMTMTLNQLLSMGFSNHDGWLARLVASKNGNLDEVLNSLFPGGNNLQ